MALIDQIKSLATRTGQEFKKVRGEIVLRNRILNPAFQISQQATLGTTVYTPSGAGAHPADGWYLGIGSTGTVAWAWQTSGITQGQYHVTFNCQGTGTPSTTVNFRQAIEGVNVADLDWGTADARPVVIRIVAMSQQARTIAVSIGNHNGSRSYPVNLTFASGEINTWKTFVFVVPGDTAGSWLTDENIGIYVRIILAAHANYIGGTTGMWYAGDVMATTGMSNFMSAVGNVVSIGRVELHPGSIIPAWQYPDYGDELLRCERRLEYLRIPIYGGYASNDGHGRAAWRFRVAKRGVPGITLGTNSIVSGYYAVGADGYSAYTAGNHCVLASGTMADARIL